VRPSAVEPLRMARRDKAWFDIGAFLPAGISPNERL
jgi:hypothetical protein